MSLNYKKHWRTSTALSIASTVLVATAAYAAHYPGGRSDWDRRSHHNHKVHEEADRAKHENHENHGDKDHGDKGKTASPIKHVIILIGENRGLDHTFGVYKPKGAGQTISNLLSKKIVKEDGSPGAHFNLAKQFFVAGQSAWYFGAPKRDMTAYDSSAHLMPQPNTNGTPQSQSASSPPFNSQSWAASSVWRLSRSIRS